MFIILSNNICFMNYECKTNLKHFTASLPYLRIEGKWWKYTKCMEYSGIHQLKQGKSEGFDSCDPTIDLEIDWMTLKKTINQMGPQMLK